MSSLFLRRKVQRHTVWCQGINIRAPVYQLFDTVLKAAQDSMMERRKSLIVREINIDAQAEQMLHPRQLTLCSGS
jgi:hypothetical protein